VLVVDDEPRVREVRVTLLSLDDHLVDTAGDGREALDKIAAHEYDVILCDLAMPELDGPGLYTELERSRPDLLGRFVIVSANAAPGRGSCDGDPNRAAAPPTRTMAQRCPCSGRGRSIETLGNVLADTRGQIRAESLVSLDVA
jgi:CheY-like chemotaxis protein